MSEADPKPWKYLEDENCAIRDRMNALEARCEKLETELQEAREQIEYLRDSEAGGGELR